MLPYIVTFEVFGTKTGVPTFPLLIVLALGVFALVFRQLAPEVRQRPWVYLILGGVLFIAGGLGAKTGQIFIELFDPSRTKPWYEVLISSGSTVTTGMIAGLGALVWFIWYDPWKMMNWRILDTLAISFPLAHAIGRIGCLANGCCYGGICLAETPFAVTYPNNWIARIDNPFIVQGPRYPAPLYEASLLVILALILFVVYRSTKVRGQIVPIYCIGYAGIRFFVETFRGDLVRGIFGGLSTGQWFSLVLGLIGLVFLVRFFFQKTNKTSVDPGLTIRGFAMRTDNTFA